ncbi:MAG TPA: polymer-forming cytoskeletal protein, partial [Planctomycetes bacterium]|nr:polymer-forming cytoskeletal protein [Planctomycetota bacterium]
RPPPKPPRPPPKPPMPPKPPPKPPMLNRPGGMTRSATG